MATCGDCGETFDTEQGLWIHRAVEHEEEVEEWEGASLGQAILDRVQDPRSTFFLGFLAGLVIVTAVVLSSPTAFQGDPAAIGEKVLNHYRDRAPPGVEYSLVSAEEHPSGTYAVTLQVTSGTTASNQTVYVTKEGDHVFEAAPTKLKEDISALGE